MPTRNSGLPDNVLTRRILRLLKNADRTYQEIATATGVSRQRVQQVADAAIKAGIGIPVRTRGRATAARRRKTATDRIRAGETIDSVARALRVSRYWVINACRAAGIEVDAPPKRSRADSAERRRQIALRVQAGESPLQVAISLDVHPSTVRLAARQAGVSPRPHGRPSEAERDQMIRRQFADGTPPSEIAAALKVNLRTVQRAVRRKQS